MKTRKMVHQAIFTFVVAILSLANISLVFGNTPHIGPATRVAVGPGSSPYIYMICQWGSTKAVFNWLYGQVWAYCHTTGMTGEPKEITVDPSGDPVILTSDNKMYWATSPGFRMTWVQAWDFNPNPIKEIFMCLGSGCPNPLWAGFGNGTGGTIGYLWNWTGSSPTNWIGAENQAMHAVNAYNVAFKVSSAGATTYYTSQDPNNNIWTSWNFSTYNTNPTESGGIQNIAGDMYHNAPEYYSCIISDSRGYIYTNFGSPSSFCNDAQHPEHSQGVNEKYKCMVYAQDSKYYVVTSDGCVWSAYPALGQPCPYGLRPWTQLN
jgi:hypothetical protein